jgi:hypothetical protein
MKHSDRALLLQKRLRKRVPHGLPAPLSLPCLDAFVGRASEDRAVRARLLDLMERIDIVARFDGALEDVHQGEGEMMGLLGFAWSTRMREERRGRWWKRRWEHAVTRNSFPLQLLEIGLSCRRAFSNFLVLKSHVRARDSFSST